MLIKILKDNKKFKLLKGEVYHAEPFRSKPDLLDIMYRVNDYWQPMCCLPRDSVEVVPLEKG